jgi:hypothetical protein
MRYGWGDDYFSYKRQFEFAFQSLGVQPAWKWFNQVLNIIGLNYLGAFVVYSFVFVTCAFVLIRSYGKESKYMYAFLIPATIISVTWTIRQGFSTSFLLLALYYLKDKKWLKVAISILIAGLFHLATLCVVAIVAFFYVFTNKKLLNWKITIPLLLFFTYLFNPSVVANAADFLNDISIGEAHFDRYLENSDTWFSDNAINSERFERNIAASAFWFGFYISFIYLGYKALKKKPHLDIMYLYNVVVFGMIFFQIIRWFELWRRFAEPLISLYFIPLGYSLSVLSKKLLKEERIARLKSSNSQMINPAIYRILLGLLLLHLILYWGRWILFNPDAMFFWNK